MHTQIQLGCTAKLSERERIGVVAGTEGPVPQPNTSVDSAEQLYLIKVVPNNSVTGRLKCMSVPPSLDRDNPEGTGNVHSTLYTLGTPPPITTQECEKIFYLWTTYTVYSTMNGHKFPFVISKTISTSSTYVNKLAY